MSELSDATQDTSLSVFDETLEKAKEVRERFVRERERLLQANLSAAVRRSQLEAIWRAASDELAALEREHKHRIATERQRLQRQAFTLPWTEKLPPATGRCCSSPTAMRSVGPTRHRGCSSSRTCCSGPR